MNKQKLLSNAMLNSRHLSFCILDKAGNILSTNSNFQNQFAPFSVKSSVIVIHELPFWNGEVSLIKSAIRGLSGGDSYNFFQVLSLSTGKQLVDIRCTKLDDSILVEFYSLDEENRESTATDNISEDQVRVLDKVTGLISHGLRAPATNMSYLLSIMDSGNGTASDVKEFLGVLKQANAQILDVIDQMGELMNTHFRHNSEPKVSLQSMISDVLGKYSKEIIELKANVVVDVHDFSDWELAQGALQMVLGQLISNSLKFSKPNVTPKIVITCWRENGDKIIEVSDNGLGFDMVENEDKLFGLFQTFHGHPESRGIGLFQVKNRLLSLGGEVSLKSKRGIGTTVTLNFRQDELKEAPLHH